MKDLDTVALLNDIPGENLQRGEVGTVVFDYGDGVYLVEFSDRLGETYKLAELRADELLPLHHVERAKMAVGVEDYYSPHSQPGECHRCARAYRM